MLKDRRIGIGVDGGYDFGIGHARQMLACAADGDGEVKARRDFLARLPDLPRRRTPARIARRT